MTLPVDTLVISLASAAALLALFALIRSGRARPVNDLSASKLSELLRSESDRVRQSGEEQARALREELAANQRGFQETTLKAFGQLGDGLGNEVKEFGKRLDDGVNAVDNRAVAIGTKLDQEIARMADDATKNRETLRQTIEKKLDDTATKQATSAKELREEMVGSFKSLGGTVSETLGQLGQQQKERLEGVSGALASLSEKNELALRVLRQTVESRLDTIRTENATKLEEMRKTVDEKLQSTLETRLGESFNRVVEQLERVHKGIGEMQSLAAGVGDLKKILSNVRVRGTFGEVQLGTLLEQFLSPEQFTTNVQVKKDSAERVEFAIRLPGRDADSEVLLPIDSKYPQADYERLIAAAESGDANAVAEASKELESQIKASAKSIRDKYIAPPQTTDFAILFLPTESLYAEVLRRPGLFELLQRDYHITLAGPSTFTAVLNALQMGFRTLAIEKRSSEVWQILGAVSNEFGKYNEVVDRLSKQLNTAAKSVENLGARTRAMNRKLRNVEKLPDETAQIILGPALEELDDAEEEIETHEGKAVEEQPIAILVETEHENNLDKAGEAN